MYGHTRRQYSLKWSHQTSIFTNMVTPVVSIRQHGHTRRQHSPAQSHQTSTSDMVALDVNIYKYGNISRQHSPIRSRGKRYKNILRCNSANVTYLLRCPVYDLQNFEQTKERPIKAPYFLRVNISDNQTTVLWIS